MRCPKCQFDSDLQTTECLKCGIVFSRYRAAVDATAQHASAPAPAPGVAFVPPATAPPAVRSDVLKELKYRIFALPLVLLSARLLMGTGLRLAAGMLAMVLHESGHAITAWLTGRWAVPMLWVTMHGDNRSWSIVLSLMASLASFAFLAWRAGKWEWACAAGAVLLVQLIIQIQPAFTQGALIVFCGDGGALILATILMATFYAPHDSALYKSQGLRWGLLVIGALAFMHVFVLWTGPFENIPFGEIEGVNLSDPSLLTQMYGWPVPQLIDRYVRLGEFCLLVLLGLYVWGLASAYLELPPRPSPEKRGILAKSNS
jgi:hypothetical protein